MDVIRTVSASLQAFLDEDLDRLARDCQVVLRERVFTGQSLLLMVVTNCSAEELSWKAVVVLYRARWQIELLFKLWESHNRLARHREGAPALEVLAVLHAKLLAVVLQHWVLVATAWRLADRSLTRAARALAEVVKEILLALGDSAALEAALRRLRDAIEKLGGTKNRKKAPGHAQLIEGPDLLDWLCR